MYGNPRVATTTAQGISIEGTRAMSESNGGEAGIRTLDTVFGPYNGLANRRLQPLGHLTADCKYTAGRHLPDRVFLELPTKVFQTAVIARIRPKFRSLRRTAQQSRADSLKCTSILLIISAISQRPIRCAVPCDRRTFTPWFTCWPYSDVAPVTCARSRPSSSSRRSSRAGCRGGNGGGVIAVSTR